MCVFHSDSQLMIIADCQLVFRLTTGDEGRRPPIWPHVWLTTGDGSLLVFFIRVVGHLFWCRGA